MPVSAEDAICRDAVFERVADILLPAEGRMPAASAVGCDRVWLEQAFLLRPDLEAEVTQTLLALPEAGLAEALARLAATDGRAFSALAVIASSGYFGSGTLRALTGHPGPSAWPIAEAEIGDYAADGMLDRVRSRGSIFKPAPPFSEETR